ncbi:MAG: pyridoxamine kinase [Clostridia bacterium]|nr:pyridoxamine kinase [Clostridia bacterium]
MYQKVLTVQDISCFGQCSLTVALPILSACGMETVILPTAILSNHTAGFKGFTVHDLTDELPAIHRQWQEEGIRFDAAYTGYLGSVEEVDSVKAIMDTMLTEEGLRIVDPAMADNGKLYPAFGQAYVEAMKSLCFSADILLPNITEACLLAGMEYREQYDRAYIDALLTALTEKGAKTVVLTGVSYAEGKTGVVVYEEGNYYYYEHEKIAKGSHGTGDVYASAFVGAVMNGKNAVEAAKIAADYTVQCIRNTQDDPAHWYGVKFEPALPKLIQALEI